MSVSVIIAICVLLLLAYIFDISAAKTRIPSVILLLFLGWVVRQISTFFEMEIPNLSSVLPIIGTIGLILIVLEGSLELELSRSKLVFAGKTSLMAFLPIVLFSTVLAYAFNYYGDPSAGMRTALINAIPFAVISSAIAIPSAQNLLLKNREFVTYESSLSDIFGVILFNFIAFNTVFTVQTVAFFVMEILLILVISFIATMALSYLLSQIKHHVKFAPIILLIILIYEVSKIFHLPALIFILLFGIFLGNLDELKQFRFIRMLRPDILNNEVSKFRELVVEIAFLIRALFFLLFGYLLKTSEIANPATIGWALAITAGIFVLRFIFLKIFRFPARPLLFLAPRGLITILLFLTVPVEQTIDLANKSLIIQVIILTALVMMFGLMFGTAQKEEPSPTLSKIT